MNWATIRPVLKDLIGNLSGLVAVWEDEPRPFTPVDTQAICILSTKDAGGQGWDECRTANDPTQPTGQELQDHWIGNRNFVLTVKVEALIQTDAGFAYGYLELVRDRLWFKSSGRTLRAINVAITDIGKTVDLTGALDDRNRSIAALDVMLAARGAATDPERYPYIGTWDVTGTLH